MHTTTDAQHLKSVCPFVQNIMEPLELGHPDPKRGPSSSSALWGNGAGGAVDDDAVNLDPAIGQKAGQVRRRNWRRNSLKDKPYIQARSTRCPGNLNLPSRACAAVHISKYATIQN
jgi:hypothetical protein